MSKIPVISVFCRQCGFLLLKYYKGGSGTLQKCYQHKIKKNFTLENGICPQCNTQFGRSTIIKQLSAIKIIGRKVYWK